MRIKYTTFLYILCSLEIPKHAFFANSKDQNEKNPISSGSLLFQLDELQSSDPKAYWDLIDDLREIKTILNLLLIKLFGKGFLNR